MNEITKKTAIRRFLIGLAWVILISSVTFFLIFGEILIKPLLIALGIIIPIMILGTIVGFKHQKRIIREKRKTNYFYIVIGALIIIINLILILVKKGELQYYLQIAVGLFFIMGGMINEKNNKKNKHN